MKHTSRKFLITLAGLAAVLWKPEVGSFICTLVVAYVAGNSAVSMTSKTKDE